MAFIKPLKVPDGIPYIVWTPHPDITFSAARPAEILLPDMLLLSFKI